MLRFELLQLSEIVGNFIAIKLWIMYIYKSTFILKTNNFEVYCMLVTEIFYKFTSISINIHPATASYMFMKICTSYKSYA